MDTSDLCVIQEDETQAAFLMSFGWESLIMYRLLTIQSVNQFGLVNDFCVTQIWTLVTNCSISSNSLSHYISKDLLFLSMKTFCFNPTTRWFHVEHWNSNSDTPAIIETKTWAWSSGVAEIFFPWNIACTKYSTMSWSTEQDITLRDALFLSSVM